MKSSSERRDLLRLALCASLLVAACASTPELPPPSTDVGVTVLIYSGRPNPRIALTDADVAELVAKVGALPANPDFEGSSVVPSILGYAGIVVTNGAGAAGLPRHLSVYGGNVALEGEQTSFRSDPNGDLENWLVDRLVEAKQLSDDTLRVIRSE